MAAAASSAAPVLLLRRAAPPLALALASARFNSALCEPEKPDLAEKITKETAPFAGAITFGGFSGYCSGYAVAKLGKGAAFLFGVGFMTFQAAAYNGYVNVDWNRVQGDFMKRLDLNNDEVLTTNMAGAAGGFAAGFVMGIRKGWH